MKKNNTTRPSLALNPSYAASHLFERPSAPDDVKDWATKAAQDLDDERIEGTTSIIIFRLGGEWLALPTVLVKEVTSRRAFHRIPHLNDQILLGIVNLNGELRLYVSLEHLLEIQPCADSFSSRVSYQQDRMMAIHKSGELWVFPVDEIEGIYNCNLTHMEQAPVNISKSSIGHIKGFVKMRGKSIGLLDEELLFASLKRCVQ